MPFGLGMWEIVALLAVLALLFGTKSVPKLARRFGTGVKELKESVGEIDPRTMFDPDEDESPKAARGRERSTAPADPKPERDDLPR